MATIVTRTGKGSKLTTAEVDSNFTELNNNKLETEAFATNNSVVTRNNSGNLVSIEVVEGRLFGRIDGGELTALTPAQVKTLLAIAQSDVAGLTTVLDGKSATGHGHDIDEVTGLQLTLDGKASSSHSHEITEVTGLQAALDEKATLSILNGLSIFAKGTDMLIAGVKTVSVPMMLATDYVLVGVLTPGGTQGALFTTGAEAGGFICKSTDAADTSTFFYIVFRT